MFNFFYLIFYLSYICNSTMATMYKRVLVSLMYLLVLKYILLSFYLVTLRNINHSMKIMLFLIVKANARSRSRSLWRYGRVEGFVQRHLLAVKHLLFLHK